MFRRVTLAGTGALLSAAAIALMLAAPSGDTAAALTNCGTTTEAMTASEAAVIDALNAYRTQNGLAPVKPSANLPRAAAFIVEDMAAKGYWDHFEPGGRSPFQRAFDCGYPTKNVGENLAIAGSGSGAVALWKTSPGHNSNMLQAHWKVAGVATFGNKWALVLGSTDDSGAIAASTPTKTPTPTPSPTPGPNDPSMVPIRRAMLQMIASE